MSLFHPKKEIIIKENDIVEDSRIILLEADYFSKIKFPELCDELRLQVRTAVFICKFVDSYIDKKLNKLLCNYEKLQKEWKEINDSNLDKEALSLIIGKLMSNIYFFEYNVILFIFNFDSYITEAEIKGTLDSMKNIEKESKNNKTKSVKEIADKLTEELKIQEEKDKKKDKPKIK